MIYDLTICLDENTLPFPDSGDPHLTWKHLVDHDIYKCQVSLFSMVTHLGTHADVPLHFVKGGKTTAQVDLSKYCGKVVCLDISGDIENYSKIDIRPILEKYKFLVQAGDIIVLRTGWEEKIGTV